MAQYLAGTLVTRLGSLAEARNRAVASLAFLAQLDRDDLSVATSGLILRTVIHDGRAVSLRPLNVALLIEDPDEYREAFREFEYLVAEIAADPGAVTEDRKRRVRASKLIGRVLYTTIQSQGLAMDYLLEGNTARKNFGMRFEELVENLFAALRIGCRPVTFRLPYPTRVGGVAKFSNQVDLVIAEGAVQSTPAHLADDEVVVSLKTSSKDRFAKVFLDQEMLSFIAKRRVKVVAIFHNDVQRSGTTKTSWTFVAGNFAAYVERFGPLTGVYYVDPPPHISREPWMHHLRTFDDLLLDDLWSRIF